MLRDLKIQNYRVFKDFSLENAARINLLVGTNNSGKSSLLEAIYLLTSESPTASLLYVLNERGELPSQTVDLRTERRLGGGYLASHIFYGHTIDKDKAIVINSVSKNQISLHVYPSDVRPRENEVTQQVLFSDETIEDTILAPRLIFEKMRNSTEPLRESLISSDGLIFFRNYPRYSSAPNQDSRLVTTTFLPYDDLSVLWDTITLTPREDNVVEALKIVEPDVERISFTSRQSSASGVLLKLRRQKDPIPLNSMGDGMRRVLSVIASLVCVDAGTLLVDEIDTGLHFSTLKDMWRLIIETSVKGNSQVFATTHSWDCVKAFQQALKESSDRSVGRLIRLERTNGHIDAIGYDAHELDIAMKQGIEFR